ncbi:hypothetical protein M752DRAFT_284588 [Aspergillus phoenicis ATCC 13157]|uniref:Uncharacterized protein n=1 Tax=Aspergillus phoenicis ATCC 13157 TaxID=1353007 RepID=A0A370PFX1_ASPPH|nr:hypothetical protein M752DRAFT_284588 [Aspergillus phoenicis ATCC 13157]
MQPASRNINELFLEYHLQQYFPCRIEEPLPVLVPETTLHHVRLLISAHSLSSFLTRLGVRLWLFGPASPTMVPETEPVDRLADSLHALIRGTDAEGSNKARKMVLIQLCRKIYDVECLLLRTHSTYVHHPSGILILSHLRSLLSNLTNVVVYLSRAWLDRSLESQDSIFLASRLYWVGGVFLITQNYADLSFIAMLQCLAHEINLSLQTLEAFPASSPPRRLPRMDTPLSQSLNEVHTNFVLVFLVEWIGRTNFH